MSKIVSTFNSVLKSQLDNAYRLAPRNGIDNAGAFYRNVEAACRMTALLAAAKVAKRELPFSQTPVNEQQVMALLRRAGIRFMPSLHSDYRPGVWLLPATAYIVGDSYGDEIGGEMQGDPFAVEPEFEAMNDQEEAAYALSDEISRLERHLSNAKVAA